MRIEKKKKIQFIDQLKFTDNFNVERFEYN